MFVELFRKTIRDQRWALLGWSSGLAFISLFLLYFYPFISRASEVLKVLDNLPPVIKNLVGKNNFMATPEGFLNLQPFSILAPLLFIIFAISKGGDATAGEEERGTLDLLLSHPLPRWRLVLAKFAAQAAALLVLSLVTYLINAYAPMIEGLRPYRIVSPFYYYNGQAVLVNGLVISHALVLAGLSAVFFAAALLFFNRRDLST